MNNNCQWTPPTGAGRQVFNGPITEGNAGTFTQDLLYWANNNHNPATMVVWFSSSGGNVQDAIAMRATIGVARRMGHKVIIVVLGRSSSCANIVMQGADEVYMDENAWLMTHNVKSKAEGDGCDLEGEAAYVRRLEDQSFRLIATPSWSQKDIAAAVKEQRTVWLTADECWERGLINGVLREPPIAVRRPLEQPGE